MNLADKVRIRREELGMSQDELATKMGYSSRSSINKIEKGRPISQKIIVRLADVLGVSVPYLMGWDADMIDSASNTILESMNEIDEKENIILEYSRRIAELDLTPEELEIVYKYAEFLSKERK